MLTMHRSRHSIISGSVSSIPLKIRSNDGRCINITVEFTDRVEQVKKRIACELGVPSESVSQLSLLISDVRTRSQVPIDSNAQLISDLMSIYASRGSVKRIDMIAANAHQLSPKTAYDVCQILKHWMSPALRSSRVYQRAIDQIRSLSAQVLASPELGQTIRLSRRMDQVTRGIELLKKLGFAMLAENTSVLLPAGADIRGFLIAQDLFRVDIAMPVPMLVYRPETPRRHRRHRLRHLRDLLASRPSMDYESLLNLENVQVGLDPKLLKALPVQTMDHDNGIRCDGVQVDCGICLMPFAQGDRVLRLPCFHAYHEDCAGSWLATSKKCPMDMSEVVFEDVGC